MVKINGKDYKINTDTTLGTEKLISKIMENPENPKNIVYMESILKDILIPSPTTKEAAKFRRSERESVFELFSETMLKQQSETKKKRSLL